MDGTTPGSLYYSGVIWLLQSSPIQTMYKVLEKQFESSAHQIGNLWIASVSSTTVDFKSATSVYEYFEHVKNTRPSTTGKVLGILDFTYEKELEKQKIIAKVAKGWLSSDAAIVNCPDPLTIHKQTSKVFDYVVSDKNIVDSLVKILKDARRGIYI